MRAVLEAKGVQFFGDTFDTGVCHMAIFADPDGNELMPHRRYAPYEKPARLGRRCLARIPRATGMPRQTRARRPSGVSSVPVETLACRGAEVSVRRDEGTLAKLAPSRRDGSALRLRSSE